MPRDGPSCRSTRTWPRRPSSVWWRQPADPCLATPNGSRKSPQNRAGGAFFVIQVSAGAGPAGVGMPPGGTPPRHQPGRALLRAARRGGARDRRRPGPQGAGGGVIKPFSNLIFEMEVVDVKDAAPQPAFPQGLPPALQQKMMQQRMQQQQQQANPPKK